MFYLVKDGESLELRLFRRRLGLGVRAWHTSLCTGRTGKCCTGRRLQRLFYELTILRANDRLVMVV